MSKRRLMDAARISCCVMCCHFLCASTARAEEIKARSKIDSVGLFKNGLVVVQRSVPVSGPGVYVIEDVPAPVHGTFWVEGDSDVESRVTMRDVDGPARVDGGSNFQEALVGQNVTIHFRDGTIPPCTGCVAELPRPRGDDAWNRSEAPRGDYHISRATGGQDFLVIDADNSRTYVDASLIASMHVDGGKTVRARRPVLLLTVADEQKGPSTLHVTYLTRGLAWAPSYRINLLNDHALDVEQQAVVKNELGDLNDCEVSLISGYPSVQLAHVLSPMSLAQNWSQFFAQMSQPPREYGGVAGSNSLTQQALVNSAPAAAGTDMAALPTADGVDVHYQSLGKRTLAEGDSLSLPVARGQAEYERVVEWTVPDTRSANGRLAGQPDSDDPQAGAWDAVRFKNPLAFAMTTAPAMVLDAGRFAGQRMSYWVNSGEENTLQITKALSVRTRSVEQESQTDERQVVWVAGSKFRKVAIKGELSISNHRAQTIHLVIKRQFSGELGKAEGGPKLTLRDDGAYSINRRNELVWTLDAKATEEFSLKYDYTVLVAD